MTRNDLVELLIEVIPEQTPLVYLTQINREILFNHPDGRTFKVSVEAYWPTGQKILDNKPDFIQFAPTEVNSSD